MTNFFIVRSLETGPSPDEQATLLIETNRKGPVFDGDNTRVNFRALQDQAHSGDTIWTFSLLHLAPSAAALVHILALAKSLNVHVVAVNDQIDTRLPEHRLIIDALLRTGAAFAASKIRKGQHNARISGKRIGGAKRFKPEQWPQIREALEKKSVSELARDLGVARQTIYSFRKEMRGY